MTKILFITANRLGDAILSTGVLDHLLTHEPRSRVTVVCGALPASLFEGVPGLERIIVLKKEPYHKHWFKLWRQVVGTRWDVVVDLRNSAVSRCIAARRRFIYTPRIPKNIHKVSQMGLVVGQSDPASPKIWITPAQQKFADSIFIKDIKVIGIGPTANWQGKIWPADRFMHLIQFMKDGVPSLADAHFAIFAAPGEEEIARQVMQAVPEDRRIDMIARGDPGQVAAVMQRCFMYIGNDSGLMHMAAAAGIKTLGLFGPTNDTEYGPWGRDAHLIRTPESMSALIQSLNGDYKNAPCLMTGLSLDAVQDKVRAILHSGN